VNIQHLESLADIVQTITGVPVRERIPDEVVDKADEVEIVDMSPQALRSRIRHGNVYPPERAEQALNSFFREGNLNALRELALRRVATAVEEDLEEYMRDHYIDAAWSAADRGCCRQRIPPRTAHHSPRLATRQRPPGRPAGRLRRDTCLGRRWSRATPTTGSQPAIRGRPRCPDSPSARQ
jgi:two-component system sensor histidine kinase KdpD